ncbi:MAG: sodium:solute symporter family protein [Phaeodactylibacter sp.]|nr:sodium:solute symporter family protein [Phaeodactylibacter sp.]
MTLAGLILDKVFQQPIQWPGFLAMLLFYGLIFYLGTYAARLKKTDDATSILLADRSIPIGLAVFTMSATWLGGGYINGSAEYAGSQAYGLIWVQAPWGYALSLWVGGLLFAGKMRRFRFRTMLEPLEQRFGSKVTALLFLPSVTGDIFWTAAILTALGTTFGTILGLDTSTSIILSAVIAILYTVTGGLWSVALTDVAQLLLLFIGLGVVLPVALSKVGGVEELWALYQEQWGAAATFLPNREALGDYYWFWWDYALLLIFGGIAWQVYFQRVLSSKDVATARRLSFLAGFVCLLAAVPAILIGMIGGVVDWAAMGLPEPPNDASLLPHVIRYLTNPWIATVGLGAIAAAVMSSVDSSILSAASLAGWNVYRPLWKPDISAANLSKVIRRFIWIIGITATLLALQIESVYQLWFLCSDFVYCLLFPALCAALFDPKANRVGILAGFAAALILRFGGGDPTLGLPVLLPYPLLEDGNVAIPFRSIAMLTNLLLIFGVSRLTQQRWPSQPLVVID